MDSFFVGILGLTAALISAWVVVFHRTLLRRLKNWRAKKAVKTNIHPSLTDRDIHDISVDAAVLERMMGDFRAYRGLRRETVFERIDSIQPDGNLITKEGLEALKNRLEKGLEEKTIEEFDPTIRVIR